jgi:SAM-dependent methyltransferase
MNTTETADRYSLGRTPQEHERLMAQARVWEGATGRLLDRIGLAPGARCLDAGCGPGETIRQMAGRVGPSGRVTGIDVDAALGARTEEMLHEAGHRHCHFRVHDVTAPEPIPDGPYDLVFARLLLFHLPQRAAVLRRLWAAVAPGGHLVVQDYDMRTVSVLPTLASVEEVVRVLNGAFGGAGCDVHAGARLSDLFAQAGVGAPDGTDVAGRIEPFGDGRAMLDRTCRSVLPAALAHGVTTEHDAATTLAALSRDAAHFPERPMLWPLLIGAWKRKALRPEGDADELRAAPAPLG